jgi:hypothetical protein
MLLSQNHGGTLGLIECCVPHVKSEQGDMPMHLFHKSGSHATILLRHFKQFLPETPILHVYGQGIFYSFSYNPLSEIFTSDSVHESLYKR